jgi:phosphatidylethanolamine/phosphatidyl-N-methylethanolamine N-methyltransferase
MTDADHRLYDWWSRHPLARRLLYAVAFLGREARFRRRTVAALDLHPGDTVVDIGCGAGEDLGRLREAVGPEGAVVGIDASAGMVARARDRVADAGWENVHVVRGDAGRLPLDGPIDAIHAAMSLSAMPDQRGAVREAARLLAPDGQLAVLDARPYPRGPLRLLNPLARAAFEATTDWQPEQDLVGIVREQLDSVAVSSYACGAIVVIRATEPPS